MSEHAGGGTTTAKAGEGHRRRSVAYTLAAAAILAAGLGARTAIVLGDAGDVLHSSVRTDVKRNAALVEDVRFVYEDEAPAAYRYAKTQLLVQSLRRAAAKQSGVARAALLVEASAQTELASAYGKASDIAQGSRYRTADGGFDIGKRLADVRAEAPALVALDPEARARESARTAWHGTLDAAATLAPALAFLLAALAEAFRRRRRLLLPVAWTFLAAGLTAGILWELYLP